MPASQGLQDTATPNVPQAGPAPALDVRGLAVHYPTPEGTVVALDGVSLAVRAGETLAVMGESGCGKSTLGRALIGLLPPPGRSAAGSIALNGRHTERLTQTQWQPLRGREIAMLFQDPMLALTPVLRLGLQFAETVRDARGFSPSGKEIRERGFHLLRSVGFDDPQRVWRSYPFQLSGGMRQRAALAIALANRPSVLVADEPTTALDVRVQAQVLAVLRDLQREMGLAVVLITHDAGVAAAAADRVAVLYAGRLVEIGPAARVLGTPSHPYTAGLLACLPSPSGGLPRPLPGRPPSLVAPPDRCPFIPRCSRASAVCRDGPHPALVTVDGEQQAACYHPLPAEAARTAAAAPPHPATAPARGSPMGPRLPQGGGARPHPATRSAGPRLPRGEGERPAVAGPPSGAERAGSAGALLAVEGLSKSYRVGGLFDRRRVEAVRDVVLCVRRGEVVGLVGASGCGKSTLARCILRLERADAGTVALLGSRLDRLTGETLRRHRRHAQIIFQDARGSLNPRRAALRLVREPLDYFAIGTPAQRDARAAVLLERVGLTPDQWTRRPGSLSSGQCQRVAIARALASEPDLLVCDEPVSALDLSVQAQVLQLLHSLQTDLGFGMLFISHNLAVVEALSHRVVVMDAGRVVETLDLRAHASLGAAARHPTTRALLDAVPRLVTR
jgi:oligopeptide/dipeptide ABC transporter ATP-binding protein